MRKTSIFPKLTKNPIYPYLFNYITTFFKRSIYPPYITMSRIFSRGKKEPLIRFFRDLYDGGSTNKIVWGQNNG